MVFDSLFRAWSLAGILVLIAPVLSPEPRSSDQTRLITPTEMARLDAIAKYWAAYEVKRHPDDKD